MSQYYVNGKIQAYKAKTGKRIFKAATFKLHQTVAYFQGQAQTTMAHKAAGLAGLCWLSWESLRVLAASELFFFLLFLFHFFFQVSVGQEKIP